MYVFIYDTFTNVGLPLSQNMH